MTLRKSVDRLQTYGNSTAGIRIIKQQANQVLALEKSRTTKDYISQGPNDDLQVVATPTSNSMRPVGARHLDI